MEVKVRNIDIARENSRDRKAGEIIAFHKRRGEGAAVYHCGRYLGVLHLSVTDDVWTAEWTEVPEDSLADY